MEAINLVIRGSRLKMGAIALGGLVFAAAGYLMISEGKEFGWFVAVFFGLASAGGFIFLVIGPPTLTLTERGFEISTAFKPAVFSWSDIQGFYVTNVSGAKMIGIAFSPECKKLQKARHFTERFTGVAGAIPNHYSKSAEEVCSILNEWQSRYGAQPSLQADGPASGGPAT